MCLNDWRWGRLIRHKITAATIGAAGTVSVNQDPARVGIMLFASGDPNGVGSTWSLNGTVAGGMGIVTSTEIRFRLSEDGELPRQAFTITSGFSGCRASIIELIAPDVYLAAAIEEFEGKYLRR